MVLCEDGLEGARDGERGRVVKLRLKPASAFLFFSSSSSSRIQSLVYPYRETSLQPLNTEEREC